MTSVFEETNISKAILKVGVPAMLGQLTTLIYNIADTYFVSLTKDPAMIAAVTLCTPILLIIMSIASIFGMGGSNVIARLLGENSKKEAGRTLIFCTYATVISGIIILLLGVIFLKPLAKVIGADSENIIYTCDYLKYIFIGAPFIMLSNAAVHLFRSIGFIKESTIGLALGNFVNIVFDFVLIVYFTPNKEIVGKVISIGIPGALITVLLSVSNIVLNKFMSIYGSNAVASYGIAYKIDMVPIMLSVGLSQGVAPLIGYYYGAEKKRNAGYFIQVLSLSAILPQSQLPVRPAGLPTLGQKEIQTGDCGGNGQAGNVCHRNPAACVPPVRQLVSESTRHGTRGRIL